MRFAVLFVFPAVIAAGVGIGAYRLHGPSPNYIQRCLEQSTYPERWLQEQACKDELSEFIDNQKMTGVLVGLGSLVLFSAAAAIFPVGRRGSAF